MAPHPLYWRVSAVLAVVTVAGLAGCALPEPRPEPKLFQGSATMQVVGDWDDVETAVRTGCSQAEVAVLQLIRLDDTHLRFELLTITDEPGTLEVSLTPQSDPAAQKSEPSILLEATVGRFQDKAWAERLIGRVARRLHDLHGVDVAPIDRS